MSSRSYVNPERFGRSHEYFLVFDPRARKRKVLEATTAGTDALLSDYDIEKFQRRADSDVCGSTSADAEGTYKRKD